MFDEEKKRKEIDNKKCKMYLTYIAEAITADSKNTGSYRK